VAWFAEAPAAQERLDFDQDAGSESAGNGLRQESSSSNRSRSNNFNLAPRRKTVRRT
jgi:hypothetical protein